RISDYSGTLFDIESELLKSLLGTKFLIKAEGGITKTARKITAESTHSRRMTVRKVATRRMKISGLLNCLRKIDATLRLSRLPKILGPKRFALSPATSPRSP